MHIANQTSALECTPLSTNALTSIWEKEPLMVRTIGFKTGLLQINHINIENELCRVQHHRFNVESAQWVLGRD
jgi:hypothetical protein